MEPTNKELITHLRKYEDSKLVRAVLMDKSTFQKEVDKFYDISLRKKSAGIYDYEIRLQPADPNKNHQRPDDLIKILRGFSTETIDETKLAYEWVRKKYEKNPAKISFSAPLAVYIASASAVLGFGYLGYPCCGGLIGLGGVGILIYYREMNAEERWKQFKDFNELNKAARIADDFFEESYRFHVLREKLEQEDNQKTRISS